MGSLMKKCFFSLFLSLSLYAQNPTAFAALGDVIYNDVAKFEQLGKLEAMRDYRAMIDDYVKTADKCKKMGFDIDTVDTADKTAVSKNYLKELRALSIDHDAILLKARERFEEALQDEEGETLTGMIALGAVNPEDYKSQLIQYYEEYGEEQNLSVIEPLYRAHEANLASESNTTKAESYETSRSRELIERMRATEKAKKESLERAVEEEKMRGKEKVMQEQKKELGLE